MPLTAQMVRASQLAEKDIRPTRVSVKERSHSDETITPEISLTVSAVLAAFTILTEDLSSLPLLLYQRRVHDKFRAYDNTYYRLMHDQPNPEHTSMVFREFIMGHLLGWGNFFGQPIFDKRGDVVELWPLRPDRMTVKRFEGERIYIYNTSDGKPRIFLSEEILHIPAFGFDGLIGYSRIALARNAIGLSISAEKYGAKFFANDAIPGTIYRHPGELSDTAYEHLMESLSERKGVEDSQAPIIIEEGMDIARLGIPNDDAQFLETRKFQVSEVARIFRVPPHMIGDVEKTTSWGSGIDSQEQGYVNHTLRPWAKRIEEHLNTRLLLKKDQGSFFYEHLMDGLLRGDIAVRYEAYIKAINNGIFTPNQVLEKENMNPYKGGDLHWRPANMVPIETGSNDGGDSNNAASALEPLWQDAITRVIKRETNDLLGASKRYQVKGQQGEFAGWLAKFYGGDHIVFMWKQFKPVLEAQRRLINIDMANVIYEFVQDFLMRRYEHVKSLSADQIVAGMESYRANAADEILSFVRDCFLKARDDTESTEDDDEW